MTSWVKEEAAWLWSWVGWAWNKAWAWAKAALNYSYDPPVHHIKYWAVIVLAIFGGGAMFGGNVVSWLDRHVLWPLHEAAAPAVQPVTLLPKNALIPTALPPRIDAAPVAQRPIVVMPPPAQVAPLAPTETVPSKPLKLYKARPRPQSETRSPFAN